MSPDDGSYHRGVRRGGGGIGRYLLFIFMPQPRSEAFLSLLTRLGIQFGLGYVCALILSLSVFGLGCELDLELNSGWVMFVQFGLGCEPAGELPPR